MKTDSVHISLFSFRNKFRDKKQRILAAILPMIRLRSIEATICDTRTMINFFLILLKMLLLHVWMFTEKLYKNYNLSQLVLQSVCLSSFQNEAMNKKQYPSGSLT